MFTRITRALILTAAALLAALLLAQSPKTFEVASVRLADPNAATQVPAGGKGRGGRAGGVRSEMGNGRFANSDNVYNFILKAYHLPNCLSIMNGNECAYLTGGPAWVRKDVYNIQATLPEGTPSYTMADYAQDQATAIYPMLEALLRDRFQLKLHHEMRELPVFLLTVAKNGPKVTPSKDIGTQEKGPNGRVLIPAGFLFNGSSGPNGARNLTLTVRHVSMTRAAETMSQFMDRIVLDRTKLQGEFDWTLDYAADPDVGPNARPGAELASPEFFSAIQEQAGLRLEASKEKVDVIVIDSIERPSEN